MKPNLELGKRVERDIRLESKPLTFSPMPSVSNHDFSCFDTIEIHGKLQSDAKSQAKAFDAKRAKEEKARDKEARIQKRKLLKSTRQLHLEEAKFTAEQKLIKDKIQLTQKRVDRSAKWHDIRLMKLMELKTIRDQLHIVVDQMESIESMENIDFS